MLVVVLSNGKLRYKTAYKNGNAILSTSQLTYLIYSVSSSNLRQHFHSLLEKRVFSIKISENQRTL